MKKILTAAALTMAFTVGAFAQTNADNTRTELDALCWWRHDRLGHDDGLRRR